MQYLLKKPICLFQRIYIFIGLMLLVSMNATAFNSEQPTIKTIIVSNSQDVYNALNTAKKNGGYTKILFNDGIYHLAKTLVINSPNITLASLSGKPNTVVLQGNGMKKTKHIDNLIYVSAKHFNLNGITLQQAGNHLIQISGADDADYANIQNCVLRDAYEQLLKVSSDPILSADYAIIENCLFEYSAGIGPQWYVGGIDAHGAKNWLVKNNVFKNIASPNTHISEHAIHFWNRSANNTIENNIIIDCDRGIGFGMLKRANIGGIIKGNTIYHSANKDPYADVGIIIENSPFTVIENNRIFLEHNYSSAIEYRFSGSKDVVISSNISNKKIRARNNAKALVENNIVSKERLDVIGTELNNKIMRLIAH